jgi:fatty acid CoA ligase FadD9
MHGRDPRVVRAADLAIDRVLPGVEAACALPLASDARRVLLTGANGFLGRALLLELLERSDAEVVCIVRAADDASARARVLEGGGPLAERRRAHASRVTVYAGDLALPRLGLATALYEELAATIGRVVHCGALVNHTLGFRDLWEPNVLGAVEIMRLATTRRRKPIAFVSSIGVAAGLRRDTPIREDEAAAALRPGFPVSAEYGAGYSATKWAGEVLLEGLADRCDLPLQIFRCGLVLADRRDGSQINETDLYSRLLVGLARTRVAPPSFYAPGVPGRLDGLPVDFVAREIVSRALASGTSRIRMHLSNDEGPSLDEIAGWVGSAGIPLERCATHAAWFARFSTALEQLDEATRRRSPFAVLTRWSKPVGEPALRFETAGLRAALEARGEAPPAIDEAFVHACLRGLGLVA